MSKRHFVSLIETVRVESLGGCVSVRGRKLPVKRTRGGGSGLICAVEVTGKKKRNNK
jgi:hypothetical protein